MSPKCYTVKVSRNYQRKRNSDYVTGFENTNNRSSKNYYDAYYEAKISAAGKQA